MNKPQLDLETRVRAFLASYADKVELQEITEDGLLKVRLLGSCSTCPGGQQYMADTLEEGLRTACPEIQGVIPVFHVNEELIDQALQILRRKD